MTRKKGIALGIVVLLVLLLAAAAWWFVPRLQLRAQVNELAEADSCFDLTVYSDALELTVPAFLSGDYLGATMDGQTLYVSGEIITLANGQRFTFGTELPDLRQMLGAAAELMLLTKDCDGVYAVYTSGEQAQKMLDLLPEGLLPVEDAILGLSVTPGDTMPEKVTVELLDATTSASCLTLTLTPTEGTPSVPQTVQYADGEAFQLTFDEDTVPLLRAALSLAGKTRYAASVALDFSASVLNVQNSFSLIYDRSLGVGTLSSDSISLYFSPTAICTESGQLVTDFEKLKPSDLLALALPLLTEGRVESLRDGSDGLYTCALTDEEMDSLTALVQGVSSILSGVTLTEGSVEAKISENALTLLSFSCEGSVKVVVSVPVTLTITLTPEETPETFTVPQAVLDALGTESA